MSAITFWMSGRPSLCCLSRIQAVLHQLVVVRLVARGAAQLGDAGALGELDPDFGNQHAFEVETDKLHGISPEVGAGNTPV
jgi:hypothetical protein